MCGYGIIIKTYTKEQGQVLNKFFSSVFTEEDPKSNTKFRKHILKL